ncbi:PREDICTED: uncharacterized protein LOC109175140 [Ipomoea nil]|uniref:uncharacterized protein LOC109175140 n=1 Tax=Ipomoea nil TaxID=35883 RepID=UPI000900B5E7|nr:PREDICTED: uncharacterized protein LOC109175140 [Ipomoea nil]
MPTRVLSDEFPHFRYPPSYRGYCCLDTNTNKVARPCSEPWATASIVTCRGGGVSATAVDDAQQSDEPVSASGDGDDNGPEQSSSNRVTALIDKLALEFKVRDMGVPSFFLGIETLPLSGGILKRAGMVDCKPVVTPVSSAKITDEVAVPYPNHIQYKSLAGALQYLTASLKTVMRYVKGTLNLGLRISRSTSMDIHAYSDSDWAGNPNDRKSTSGFAVFLGSNLISWVCWKQRTVARSSTEAEYNGLADVSAEVTWLVSLLNEIGIPPASPPRL